ncbi:MAG: hypothetical protein ACLFNN_03445, partial [Candidatus Paceibacterota bacterium]
VSEEYKKESNNIEELRNYLLGFAADHGFEDMTEMFMGKMIMSDEWSEKLHEVIEDYNDENFWHELETRLGKRDFERTMTEAEREEIKKSGWYPSRIHDVYEKWSKEFEKYGINRLEIKEE